MLHHMACTSESLVEPVRTSSTVLLLLFTRYMCADDSPKTARATEHMLAASSVVPDVNG
jgi:hypothetical protein